MSAFPIFLFGMLTILILLGVLAILLYYLNPKLDWIIVNNEKLRIIWFNTPKGRNYIVINKLL